MPTKKSSLLRLLMLRPTMDTLLGDDVGAHLIEHSTVRRLDKTRSEADQRLWLPTSRSERRSRPSALTDSPRRFFL